MAYEKTKQRRQIEALMNELPDPPVRPLPKEYSGKFNVRIPKALHAELVVEASEQGVSLNQLVVTKLARRLQAG
jgi:predicted HicB family RNase H-like nuclease